MTRHARKVLREAYKIGGRDVALRTLADLKCGGAICAFLMRIFGKH